ncbi:MAG: hypothetical protein QOJ65_2256, partial [Fimbriimonadaceae bacterium]|nr:hypothetical protein [Fimbriimonadaceae bacterium]
LNTTKWKPSTYTVDLTADFQSFCGTFAYKYYWGVKYGLTNAGLKSFYLGSRFADYTPEVVYSAGQNCDILSYNIYGYASDVPWAYLNSLPKPVLISEFGFGLKGWGTFGGPAPMWDAGGRAFQMREFLNQANATRNIVGCHYYCYGDQPITGRWSDYENGGFGIVDVADTPYSSSVQTLREFTANMYTVRATGSSGGGGGTGGASATVGGTGSIN